MATTSHDTGASKADAEKLIQRNPHPDFKKVERERAPWEQIEFHLNQVKDINWKAGTGANDDEWKKHKKTELDPYGEGRQSVDNYKMLISAIVPRFIGFVSTVSADGTGGNLAPFSYVTLVNHDPPVFVIGFAGSRDAPKDTLKNVLETKECTINVISEWFAEAANYTSINAPYGTDEWKMTGLTPIPSRHVKAPHVGEAMFSVEAKLVSAHDWTSPTTGKKTGCTVFVEGVNFHIREDAWVEGREGSLIDPVKLKPISRLGGITYARSTTGFELPRPDYEEEIKKDEIKDLLNGNQ